ncbi:MAG TPA: cytochrome b/b6 domain-containing protein [Acidisoma sp.]|jgi:cytochrome b561|uniref:cytochrome b/b6 domain-containing protein n=1 Tax=Acidisoma sp. TaxID=1872115 RepID=UPI002B732793|nr:cytochrome b/b6 domain-containing protein [Acidisoma sp.]HTI03380.1 cytochrome b/b6 domain-containing protein [Acidisoma sp.]
MSFIAPRQILRRSLLSRAAVYQSVAHGEARRSHATRLLHLLLLLSVINQLGSSQFMSRPFPGEAPSTLYALHEYVGMGSFGLVLGFWLWTLVRRGETTIGRLFPWFSPPAIGAVIRDAIAQLRSILQRDPLAESDGAFASAVHGLGLLTLTGMAATGTLYFVMTGSSIGHLALGLHKTMANLMWIYLFGHAGIAVLHHLLGHDILRRMFWVRRGITITTPRPRNRQRSERDRAEI